MKVAYYSLGCKVNLYESESIINKFLDNGFTLVDYNDVSDVYIINTCTVTETGDSKSRKIIREAIRRNNKAIVAVMGCSSQLRVEDYKKIDGVDIVVGTTNRTKIYDLVIQKLKSGKGLDCSYYNDVLKVREYEELKLDRFTDKTRGFVKVQDGCDNYCAYCTVPFARGHIKSRNIKNAYEEIKKLSDNGMKEIVLAGINTGAYGKDLGLTLSDLLKELVKIPTLGRLRISSIEETEITKELLDVIYENREHFCEHFHIPLQGGADNTLKNMKRKYNTKEYKEKIDLIRSYFPLVNITTDILAGFAKETKEDFEDAKKFIREIGFGEMHVFPYSRRPLTLAYNYDGQIDPLTKKIRVNELLELNKELAINYRNKFLNTCLDVIVEKNNNGLCFGHTSNYLEVEFNSKDAKENDCISVLITKIDYPKCFGIICEGK